MLPQRGPEAISPTAHYTGHVWGRHGLSDPELATREGRLLFELLRPAMLASRVLGGPTVEGQLLARHRIIDAVLADAIDDGRVTQVVEVASGLSPRGLRFARRYGDRITYLEADLPAMARRKREALERVGALSRHHRVVELDALQDSGPLSLAEVAQELDPTEGLAVVSEGLVNYFDRDAVAAMWQRFAAVLRAFRTGLYVSDLVLRPAASGPVAQAFLLGLQVFVRGRVHLHFEDADQVRRALRKARFTGARVHRGDRHPAARELRDDPGSRIVRVLEARIG
ncbi:class I SAM-dependent methyltransferase [Conexibacter sp. SYSU D00693]|uniref:class I SAM-dependent methyltransferase n=1 Tax=Conexibacter sp. SYSU D00693 TaxID=2812560 RepID=UPI00196A452C|nr:class I SAM-dependent methyltransferase [Conexibacter sp. SYSU D00693]